MPDPDFDPDEINKVRWFVIKIPFEWIAKAWWWIFIGPLAYYPRMFIKKLIKKENKP